jgi:uroporphyrinogen decarboxylase
MTATRPSMTHRQRVLGALEKTGYDRIPIKHEATPEVNKMLMGHFGLRNMEQLLRVVGDDFRYVEPVFCGPELRTFPDGSVEGYFGERYKYAEFDAGRYLEACYLPFAGVHRLEDLDRSHFPSADWFDYSTIRQQAEELRGQGFAVCCGTAGDMDFINGIARARGMEQVLMDLIDDSPVYLEIMRARCEFFYEVQRRTLEAAGGLIDFCHAGEDFGNQRGPMISLSIFDRHFAPKYGKYFDMVHSHRARTMVHMCGCCEAFLPRLIELGLDVYDVVQPTTPSMDIAVLKEKFGDRLTFCGSVCRQRLPGVRRETSSGKSAAGWNYFPPADCFSAPHTLCRSARLWRTSWPCTARRAVCGTRSTTRSFRSAATPRGPTRSTWPSCSESVFGRPSPYSCNRSALP